MAIFENLKKFIEMVRRSSKTDWLLKRWQDRIEEEQQGIGRRIISLCFFPECIPEHTRADYTKLLLEVLNDENLMSGIEILPLEREKIVRFAEICCDADSHILICKAVESRVSN